MQQDAQKCAQGTQGKGEILTSERLLGNTNVILTTEEKRKKYLKKQGAKSLQIWTQSISTDSRISTHDQKKKIKEALSGTLESKCKRPRARGRSSPAFTRKRESYIQRNGSLNVQKSGWQETGGPHAHGVETKNCHLRSLSGRNILRAAERWTVLDHEKQASIPLALPETSE